jgi:uncharacterized membrane-anchored protein YjiN (DUF445 family)
MSASSSSEQPQNTAQNVKSDAAPAVAPKATSCRKKKSDSQSTTFFGDIVEHIDEFVHASYDEHKSCLTKTLNKVCVCVLLVTTVEFCITSLEVYGKVMWPWSDVKSRVRW